MQVTILGTGTSQGVPVLGCNCEVCLSDDPKDKRLRCAIHLKTEHLDLVIDVGPDFRQQMLSAQVKKLDAVLITHEHNDHIIGMDDLRPFNFKQKMDMPIHATISVQEQLKRRFDYAFIENPYPGAPKLKLVDLDPDQPIAIGELNIIPLPVLHGSLPVVGFRIADFTYLTDVNFIPESTWELLAGTKKLIISALFHKEHHAHFNLTQALEVIERLQPAEAYITHVGHQMGKAAVINAGLPENVKLAYDGQQIQC